MLRMTDDILIDESELHWEFVRSSGPGGQHVNKVSTAVILRFDAAASPSIDNRVKKRLRQIAGRKMTADGKLIIRASRFRSQAQNRQDAIERLRNLIQRAAARPKPRRKTRPSRASIERRLAAKQHRSKIKRQREKVRS
jgi:ribosome-associated protein